MDIELMLYARRRRSQGRLSAWMPVRPVAKVPTVSPSSPTPALHGVGLFRP